MTSTFLKASMWKCIILLLYKPDQKVHKRTFSTIYEKETTNYNKHKLQEPPVVITIVGPDT